MPSRVLQEGCGDQGVAVVVTKMGSQPFSSPSSSSSFFDNLPHEVFDEILRRLPLKDTHRCKCVSKRWLNWISNPHFVRCYVQYQTTVINASPLFALFYQFDATKHPVSVTPNPNESGISFTSSMPIFSESRGFSLNYLPHSNPLLSTTVVAVADDQQPPAAGLDDHLRLLGSSNGLVLCSTSLIFQRVYYVCNPLTMQWVELPPPPTSSKRVRIGFITRIDDKDFKRSSSFRVVRICCGDKMVLRLTTLNLEIFSSETGTWTESLISCPNEPLFGTYFAVDCKGMLYWSFKSILFVFDPYNPSHRHGTIDLPNGSDRKSTKNTVGECQGHLRFAHFGGCTITIWELNDNYSDRVDKWSLVQKLHLKVNSIVSPLTVVAFHPSDRDILYLWLPGRIWQWNMRGSRKFKRVCELAHSRASLFQYHMVFPFVLPWWPTPLPPPPHSFL